MDLALRRRSDTADAAARLAGRIFSASSQRHFRQNHHISNDTTTDTTSDVISGKWKLKPSRSIEMSPGSRPHGSLASQGHRRPTATSSSPNTTSKRCMRGLYRYWNALLANGDSAEQCGWLKDRFGLSWQIVPTGLGEMMADPDRAKAKRAADAMLKMVKLDIAVLKAAHSGTNGVTKRPPTSWRALSRG